MAEHSIDRYDGLGRLIQHTERNRLVDGATTDVVSVHRYDALGRETCASQPFTVADGSGLQPPQSCTSQAHVATQYDSVGRIQQAIKADGTRTVHSYGIEAGLAVHDVIDANRHRKRSSSDVLGRLAEVVEMIGNCDNEWAVDGFGCQSPYETEWSDYAVTRYSYDTLGQLIAVVNDATGTPVTSTMEYDSLGRKIAMSDPDMGDWQYAYDVAGNRVLQIDAKGDRVCSYYDELNRLIARGIDESAACPDSAPPSDGPNHLATYVYDSASHGIGQLAEVKWGPNPQGNRNVFAYDGLGRRISQTRTIDGTSFTMMTLSFDAKHRPLQIRYPNQDEVIISYDREGEQSLTLQRSGNGGTYPLVTHVDHNVMGQVRQMGLGNNLTTDYAYTPNNFRLQSITSGAIQNLSYTYDAVGNVRTIQDGSNENQVQQFECDHLNRLTHAFTVGAGPGQYDRRYEYDVLGNIARRFENTIQYEYSYNGDRPHAVTAIQIPGMGGASWTYGYDNNGNMDIRNENAQLHNQTFDVLNRLVAVTVNGETTEFGYGESEQRVKTLKPDGTQVSVDPNFRFRERIWAN